MLRLQVIKRRVHLHQREIAGVVLDAPRLHAGLIVVRRVERLVVRPARRADTNVRRHRSLLAGRFKAAPAPRHNATACGMPAVARNLAQCTSQGWLLLLLCSFSAYEKRSRTTEKSHLRGRRSRRSAYRPWAQICPIFLLHSPATPLLARPPMY